MLEYCDNELNGLVTITDEKDEDGKDKKSLTIHFAEFKVFGEFKVVFKAGFVKDGALNE